MDVKAFIKLFLKHDTIYDPVKAHEYYERTKELKGKRSASNLRTKKQKEGWSYVQSRIKDLKKVELKTTSENNKRTVEQLRATGAERRKALSEKIKALMEQITSDVKRKIDSLPEGLSKEERAIEIAKIRAESKTDREAKSSLRKNEREQIASSLKSTIDQARTNYNSAREAIKVKYERKLQSEYDAIRTNQ